MIEKYLPVLLYGGLFLATGVGIVGLSLVLQVRRKTKEKGEPYECGMPLAGNARGPLSVKFYLVAILFILFDVETVLLIPWAVTYKQLGLFGLVAMFVFLGLLGLALIYEWRRGGLEWQ